jgi:polyisoprenoid-binding protein YceI
MLNNSNVRCIILSVGGVLALNSAALAEPQTYMLDPSHTNVLWSASHFGFSSPSGKFTDATGELVLDESKPETSMVNVTIKTGSVLTGIPKFDTHLTSADFFDSAKFPNATFKSTQVTLSGSNSAKVAGDLTLHGVTKPVVLNVKLNKIGESPISKAKTAGFSATTVLKRSEFGINYALPGVSDEVAIAIEAEAAVQAAKP